MVQNHQYYFLVPAVVVTATQICTDVRLLPKVQRGVRVTPPYFLRTKASGLMACAAECMLRRRCKAFSHQSGACYLLQYNSSSSDLNTDPDTSTLLSDIDHWPQSLIGACASHTCPDNARCQERSPTEHTCIVTDCLRYPDVSDATLTGTTNPPAETPVGTVMNYICHAGFLQESSTVTCLANGTWSSVRCRPPPTSCAEVKHRGISSTDGEFWLDFGKNQTARIYCYNMQSTNPQEFITLAKPNRGYYPDVQNLRCNREKPLAKPGCGTRIFTKIRIELQNLTVIVKDTTFARGPPELKPYGGAYDCYTNNRKCGPKGTFNIDLSGTGFRLNPNQTWKTEDYYPIARVEWVDSARVNLFCGGYCGWCLPEGSLKLELNNS
ncbi:A disintegrin and metalloproteinase with thrombospondin motifs 9-like [Haliotis asinina]|uniref:A disintegrin and metalloproteinase with thrombospondin motifs 9-like n=1 Tax=Haliotis asinina TaxID=109174 RepID=UPI00353188A5